MVDCESHSRVWVSDRGGAYGIHATLTGGAVLREGPDEIHATLTDGSALKRALVNAA